MRSRSFNQMMSFFAYKSHSQVARVIIVGGVLVMMRCWQFFLGSTLFFGDNYSLMVPGKLYTSQWLLKGVLPLWNPYLFAGISWVGDINQSIFYPSTLLFMVFPAAIALNVNIMLHFLISFVGMYYLSKKFVRSKTAAVIAATIWTFSPQLAGAVNNISTFQSLSWMPVVIWAGLNIQKKWGVLSLVLAIAAQLLGGYPQHVLYTVPTAILLSTYFNYVHLPKKKDWWHWLKLWLMAGILTVGLTAFVWMPFLEEVANSTRSIQADHQAAAGSLEFSELVKLFIPYLYDNPVEGIKWGPSWNKPPNVMIYLTWFGLVAISYKLVKGKKTALDWLFGLLILVSFLIALGDNLPLFYLLKKIPLFGITRGLSTVLMVPSLLGALWIAVCLDNLQLSRKFVRTLMKFCGFLAVIILLMMVLTRLNFELVWYEVDEILNLKLSSSVFHTLARDKVILQNVLSNLFVNSVILLFAVWSFHNKRAWLLIGLLFLEMSFNTQGHFFFAPHQVYRQGEQSDIEKLLAQADLDNYRMLTRNYNSPYADFGAYWDALSVRAPFSDSYVDQQELKEFNHLIRMRDGLTPNWNITQQVPLIHGYTTLLPLAMHQIFAGEGQDASINDLPQIDVADPALQTWAVRYYLVDTWFPSYDEVMPAELIDEQGVWRLYEISNVQSRFRDEHGNDLQIKNLHENPNQLEFEIENNAESAQIVIADRYDHNWRAKVNGREVPITNYLQQRQFPIDAGFNRIVMWYSPKLFHYGIIISSLTLGMVVTVMFVTRRRVSNHQR